ncbi:hypothetical protein K501DRAFT_328759 [Backusella circina FSU 941]|nr:hypothetical protein K501DRAFT_328759 [Backusella circina FSU 941]
MGQYKCCCCIPIRAGVLIIALLTAALYIFCTVGLLINKSALTAAYDGVSSTTMTGIFYTEVVISLIFAVCALFGVVGSITQNRKMISLFKGAYWLSAIIEFIICIARIIVFSLNRSALTASCVAEYTARYPGDSSAEAEENCSNAVRLFLIIGSIVSVIISLIEIYFATVISSYATRLRRTNLHEKLRNLEDFPEPPSKNDFY